MKTYIKRIFCACFAIVLTLSLISCGNNDGNTDSTTVTQGGTNVDIDIGKNTDKPAETTDGGETKAPDVSDAETDAPETPDTEKTPEAEDGMGTFTESDLSITINGVRLSIGDDFLPNVDVIGDAEIVEGQACLGGGYDTNYYYGGEDLVVYTLAQDGKQIIYDIYISSADYATDKGARVGETTRDKLFELYGEPMGSLPVAEEYSIDGSDVIVSFKFEDDILAAIDILDGEVN